MSFCCSTRYLWIFSSAKRFRSFQYDGRRFNCSRRTAPKAWNDKFDQLVKILGQPPDAVRVVLNRGRALLAGDEDSIARTWKVLQKYGFGIGALQEYPKLLLETPVSTENYIMIMKESGFNPVRPLMLLKFRDLAGRSIATLKGASFIPPKTDVLENYLKLVEIPADSKEDIRKALSGYEENLSLVETRSGFLSYYLGHILDTPPADMQIILNRNRRSRYRSIEWVTKIVDVLSKDIHFSKEKIRSNAFLLQCDPSRISEIMNTIPTLGGKPILEIATSRPKILASSAKTLYEIDILFQKHGISAAAISKYPEMYTLSSNTIKARLEELDRIPQFTTFKSHPRIARVIYYQNKVRQRISDLEAQDVQGVSLHVLSSDKKRYDKFMRLGEVANKGADVTHFVSNNLGEGVTRAQVRKSLAVHPNWRHVPVVNVKTTLCFLKETKGHNVSQILKGLPLILYPVESIEQAMHKVKEIGEAEEADDFYLQMVLYFLERPGHFSGDGVWANRTHRKVENEHALESGENVKQSAAALIKGVRQGNVQAFEDESFEMDEGKEFDEEPDVLRNVLPLDRF